MNNTSDVATQILIDIRDAIRVQGDAIRVQGEQIAGLRQEMHTELTGLRHETRGMRVDLCERIDRTNSRIDNLIVVTGNAHRAHDARLDQLDARVTRLEVSSATESVR